jgi:hypothetical protein
MPAYFAYPVPLPYPVSGQLGYCFEYYSVDDNGIVKPDGWYDWVTTGQIKTWDVARCLRGVYRRSADNTADGKLAMLAIPQKVLAYPNVVTLVYTVSDNDKRDLVATYDRTTLKAIVGATG